MNRSSNRNNRRHSRQGLAALLAILLLLLIASILAALGTMTAADSRRARSQHTEAQLTQLLTAGAALASRELENPSTPAHEKLIPLPPELSQQQATLKLNFQPAATSGHLHVSVLAGLGKHQLAQTLDFVPTSGGQKKWKLNSVTLGPESTVR
jgi:type II secretory pathway pseudopilin PulG